MARIGAETQAAFDEALAMVRSCPAAALDWAPGEGEWSVKGVARHLSGVGGFYGYILDRVRASDFGLVTLDRAEIGRRMGPREAAFDEATTPDEVAGRFAAGHEEALAVIATIAPEEIDRPFRMQSFRPGADPDTTTLRARLVDGMGVHLRDHLGQLRGILEAWERK